MSKPVVLTFTLLLAGAALAQTSSPLKLVLTHNSVRTVKQDGKDVEQLVPAPRNVRPGDVLVEVLNARNEGTTSLSTALTVPVPTGTQYLGQPTPSADRWTLQFSADSGKTFAEAPLKERVAVTENGKTTTREVAINPNRYTHVRWVLTGINPAETLKFNFRVKVK